MAECTNITISTCPSGVTCGSCKEIVKTHCIKYIGDTLEYLGVESGDLLKDILIKIDQKIGDLSGAI